MLNLRSIVPIAQRIECSPAKAEMKVRFLLGTHFDSLRSLSVNIFILSLSKCPEFIEGQHYESINPN